MCVAVIVCVCVCGGDVYELVLDSLFLSAD